MRKLVINFIYSSFIFIYYGILLFLSLYVIVEISRQDEEFIYNIPSVITILYVLRGFIKKYFPQWLSKAKVNIAVMMNKSIAISFTSRFKLKLSEMVDLSISQILKEEIRNLSTAPNNYKIKKLHFEDEVSGEVYIDNIHFKISIQNQQIFMRHYNRSIGLKDFKDLKATIEDIFDCLQKQLSTTDTVYTLKAYFKRENPYIDYFMLGNKSKNYQIKYLDDDKILMGKDFLQINDRSLKDFVKHLDETLFE